MSAQPTPQNPMLGIVWMLASGLSFVAVTALVKFLGPGMPPAQSAFLRYLIGLVFLIPVLRPLVTTSMPRSVWGIFILRGVVHSGGVMLWFFAMTQIPLAEVTALNYLTPVYVTIAAALFLGEKLAIRRIAAVLAALVGALIVLRPGMRELNAGHIAMLFTAVLFSVSYLTAKILSDKVSVGMIVGMLSVWVTVGLAPFAYAVWVPPTWEQIAILAGVAVFATAGHYFMTMAFAVAPIVVTQPVVFLQLIWATLLGALVFAEPVDIWVIAGGGLILGSVTFIAWREAVLKRRAKLPVRQAVGS